MARAFIIRWLIHLFTVFSGVLCVICIQNYSFQGCTNLYVHMAAKSILKKTTHDFKTSSLSEVDKCKERRNRYFEDALPESPCIHALVKSSPVLDLIVSLDAVCPIRSYWRRLEDSSGTSTEYSGPFFHVYMISLLG